MLPKFAITAIAAVAMSASIAVSLLPASAAASSTDAANAADNSHFVVPASGSWTVIGHGNGHGHGLSQYGSYGRARAGQSVAQIVSFYYPGASLQTGHPNVGDSPVRVQLGDAGAYTTIAAARNLSLTGVRASLNTSGVSQFRLVPSGTGLGLQALGLTWAWVNGSKYLPSTATFSSPTGRLTLIHGDGSRSDYRGTLSAVSNGSTDTTVNTLGLDDYVRGVAPNESPSSWPAAALQAQVVAARTYALFDVQAQGGSGSYDVCDSSNCQVYRGASSEATSTNAAVDATAGDVLLYQGTPIFAQFSSSNGGWTSAGGKPYLIARADPFDNADTDPWFNWTRSVAVSQVAGYYGLSTVTGLRILARDGNGDWGGGVTQVVIDGTRNGASASIAATGYSIRSAMDLPLQWFTITNGAPPRARTPVAAPGSPAPSSPAQPAASKAPISVPGAVTLRPGNASVTVAWQPPVLGAKSVLSYRVTISGFGHKSVPAAVHEVHFVGLSNGRPYRVTVQALGAAVVSSPATIVLETGPLAARVPALPLRVSQWPGNRSATLYWARPAGVVTGYTVTVIGGARYLVSPGATQFTVPRLPNRIGQTLYVRAFNGYGPGPALGIGVRPMPLCTPPVVVSLSSSVGSASLTWSAPASNSTPAITGYSITLIGGRRFVVPAGTRSFVLNGLVPGTRYRVYLRAMNSYGESPAAMTAFTAK